jgi:hypothetical protein
MIGFGTAEIVILIVIFGIFGVIGSIFWIWALVDCATKEPSDDSDKIIWILIIIFTHFIGALLYLLIRRPKRKKLYGE